MYWKTSGKSHALAPIFINRSVEEDLVWLTSIIGRCVGIHFVDSLHWLNSQADLVLWTDTSTSGGFGFYYAGRGFAYQLQPYIRHSQNDPSPDIFFFELIVIMSAIHHVTSFKHPPRRVLLFTDSLDSVGVLSSLAARTDMHNAALRGIAEVILVTGIDLWVRHIPGKKNLRADLLSRLLFEDYHQLFPSDRVVLFQPPRELLSVQWRKCF